MGAAGFGGPFAPIVQYEKWKIHTVFPHFPYFRLGQNLPPNLLAPLCGVALGKNVAFDSDLELLASEGHIQITDDIIKFIRFWAIVRKNTQKSHGFCVFWFIGMDTLKLMSMKCLLGHIFSELSQTHPQILLPLNYPVQNCRCLSLPNSLQRTTRFGWAVRAVRLSLL